MSYAAKSRKQKLRIHKEDGLLNRNVEEPTKLEIINGSMFNKLPNHDYSIVDLERTFLDLISIARDENNSDPLDFLLNTFKRQDFLAVIQKLVLPCVVEALHSFKYGRSRELFNDLKTGFNTLHIGSKSEIAEIRDTPLIEYLTLLTYMGTEFEFFKTNEFYRGDIDRNGNVVNPEANDEKFFLDGDFKQGTHFENFVMWAKNRLSRFSKAAHLAGVVPVYFAKKYVSTCFAESQGLLIPFHNISKRGHKVVRLREAINDNKYMSEPESGVHPYIPFTIQEFKSYFSNGEELSSDLLLNEGMFKCLYSLQNFKRYAIAFTSAYTFRNKKPGDGDSQQLTFEAFKEIISDEHWQRRVIIADADYVSNSDVQAQYNDIYALCVLMGTQNSVELTYPSETYDGKKGIDDVSLDEGLKVLEETKGLNFSTYNPIQNVVSGCALTIDQMYTLVKDQYDIKAIINAKGNVTDIVQFDLEKQRYLPLSPKTGYTEIGKGDRPNPVFRRGDGRIQKSEFITSLMTRCTNIERTSAIVGAPHFPTYIPDVTYVCKPPRLCREYTGTLDKFISLANFETGGGNAHFYRLNYTATIISMFANIPMGQRLGLVLDSEGPGCGKTTLMQLVDLLFSKLDSRWKFIVDRKLDLYKAIGSRLTTDATSPRLIKLEEVSIPFYDDPIVRDLSTGDTTEGHALFKGNRTVHNLSVLFIMGNGVTLGENLIRRFLPATLGSLRNNKTQQIMNVVEETKDWLNSSEPFPFNIELHQVVKPSTFSLNDSHLLIEGAEYCNDVAMTNKEKLLSDINWILSNPMEEIKYFDAVNGYSDCENNVLRKLLNYGEDYKYFLGGFEVENSKVGTVIKVINTAFHKSPARKKMTVSDARILIEDELSRGGMVKLSKDEYSNPRIKSLLHQATLHHRNRTLWNFVSKDSNTGNAAIVRKPTEELRYVKPILKESEVNSRSSQFGGM